MPSSREHVLEKPYNFNEKLPRVHRKNSHVELKNLFLNLDTIFSRLSERLEGKLSGQVVTKSEQWDAWTGKEPSAHCVLNACVLPNKILKL